MSVIKPHLVANVVIRTALYDSAELILKLLHHDFVPGNLNEDIVDSGCPIGMVDDTSRPGNAGKFQSVHNQISFNTIRIANRLRAPSSSSRKLTRMSKLGLVLKDSRYLGSLSNLLRSTTSSSVTYTL